MLEESARRVYTGSRGPGRYTGMLVSVAGFLLQSLTQAATSLMRFGQWASGLLLTAMIPVESINRGNAMLAVTSTELSRMPAEMAWHIATFLTNPGSETNRDLLNHANERAVPLGPDTQFVVCLHMNPEREEWEPIAWASLGYWRELPAYQTYVAARWRGNRIASSLAALLFAANPLPMKEVATFSPLCTKVALRMGLTPREFVQQDGEWNEQERVG